jgi:transposase InsO family protein
LKQFPFRILAFHSDNGSEFINHTIAALLNKLLIEQTKSRPRHSGDNGLVETKNGAVIRKHMGYDHIASEHAETINAFYEEHFNPYLNFHRPCAVPETKKDSRGKTVRVYRWYATPWEILRQTPGVGGCLKDNLTIEEMEKRAGAESDTVAATKMNQARRKLFASFEQRRSA